MATSCLWLSVLPNKKTRLPSQQQAYKYSCKYKYTNTIWNMNTNINTNKPKLIIFSLPERMWTTLIIQIIKIFMVHGILSVRRIMVFIIPILTRMFNHEVFYPLSEDQNDNGFILYLRIRMILVSQQGMRMIMVFILLMIRMFNHGGFLSFWGSEW